MFPADVYRTSEMFFLDVLFAIWEICSQIGMSQIVCVVSTNLGKHFPDTSPDRAF